MKTAFGALCIAALLGACGGGGGGAVTPPPVDVIYSGQALQAEVERFRAANNLPGISVVTVVDGRIESVAAGVRSIDAPAALRNDDQMAIASLTKAQSATLIARLVEQGKLRWDSNLGELFPTWRDSMHPSMRSVTIEQLLRHRGGLKRDVDTADLTYLRTRASGDMNADRRTIGRYILQQAPMVAPNTTMAYSNLGYMVVGLVAEAAGGASYANLMQTDIFAPLQMRAAVDLQADGSAGAVAGHLWGNGNWFEYRHVGANLETLHLEQAGGGVMISMAEYGKYLNEHVRGLRGTSTHLSQSSVRRLHEPIDGYAMGWGILDFDTRAGRYSTHTGSISNFFSVTVLVHGSGRASAIVCNCDSPTMRDEVIWFANRLAGRPEG